jgi:hypothetical protein
VEAEEVLVVEVARPEMLHLETVHPEMVPPETVLRGTTDLHVTLGLETPRRGTTARRPVRGTESLLENLVGVLPMVMDGSRLESIRHLPRTTLGERSDVEWVDRWKKMDRGNNHLIVLIRNCMKLLTTVKILVYLSALIKKNHGQFFLNKIVLRLDDC